MPTSLLPRMATCALLACLTALLTTTSAGATTVHVLERDGHTRVVNDPYVPGATSNLPRPPASASITASAASASARKKNHKHNPKKPAVTVKTVLVKLRKTGAISPATYTRYIGEWNSALAEERKLTGARRANLADVTELVHNLAVGGKMTVKRLPVLFLTVTRNAQWWKQGTLLGYPDRVQFAGSQLLWQYYPGAGLQLQVLGNFGEADGFYESGRTNWPKLLQLLSELKAVAVPRAGGTAWEYYFNWEGGSPPWVSAMAQATGLIAMTNGYLASHDRGYLTTAHRMLPLLEHGPPNGTAVQTPLGTRFLQYSFAPGTDIINAFLQTLIGLYDYHAVSKDPIAQRLFNAGNAQAKAELPSFVLGGWSLYQPGVIDTVSYHELVTGFLQSLCQKLGTPVYCHTYSAFADDLVTTPKIQQLTTTVRAGHRLSLRFHVSKLATVGAIVSRAGKNYLYTDQLVRAGTRSFTVPSLKRGTYTVSMSAKDMVGHFTKIEGTLTARPHT